MKKLTNSDMIGKAGISLVGLRLAEIGFLFHETGSGRGRHRRLR